VSSPTSSDRRAGHAYTPGGARPLPDRLQALAPAIPMDAAMTCAAALARLAEYHAWFDEDHPVMRDVVGLRMSALGIDDPAIVLDALRAAHADAQRPWTPGSPPSARPPEHVVVRRTHETTVYWYERATWYVVERALARPLGDTLLEALDLHEYTSDGVTEIAEYATGGASGPVIVRGGALVGVARPMAAAAPPEAEPEETFADTVRGGSGLESRVMPPPPPPPPPLAPSAALPPKVGSSPGGSFMDWFGGSVGGAARPASDLPVSVTAYPDVLAPQAVVAGAEFDVELGLANEPVAGVAGAAMQLAVAPDQRTFDVEVRVSADGFDAPDGWTARFTTPVRDVTRGRARLTLVAREIAAPVGVGSLLVHFIVDGVLRGAAARAVVVLRDASVHVPESDPRGMSRTDAPPTRPLQARAPAAGESADAATSRTDIEIVIAKPDRDPTSGRFTLALRTPHAVPVPDDLPPIDLGKDPQTFAKTIIDEMLRHDRTPFADTLLRGIGRNVARQLPPEFWTAFDAVARHVRDTLGRAPTVLLLASENLVPWELAALPSPLYPDLPPYLAAQTSLGRWILDAGAVPLPPATTVPVKRMAALAGHYPAESGLQPLPNAIEEAQELEKRFGAVTSFATADAVASLLDAALKHGLSTGGAEVIHFAGHGEVDPRNPGSGGLFLDNGMPIHPMLFASTPLGTKHQPFLFLNACMVGAGGEMLGDAAGFPGQCLGGGFRGMVAPLWAVRDTVARQVALDFYAAAFGGDGKPGRPLGEVLREIRGRYATSVQEKQPVPTYLAYVLYGHPGLVLSR
jgi:hypothetical protein